MSRRVLVVEDSSAVRAFVRATLEDDSATVTEAASGFEALRVLPREVFDVVVIDINMPDINGLEVASFMRKSEAHRSTPIVLMSTEASERDRTRGLAVGADAFLAKPFTPEALRETITNVCSRKGHREPTDA